MKNLNKGNWKAINGTVVTDSFDNTMSERYDDKSRIDEIEHYGGYIIAESMTNDNAIICSVAKELYEFMLNIENDNNSIPKPIWDIKVKVMEKILKSQNNEK